MPGAHARSPGRRLGGGGPGDYQAVIEEPSVRSASPSEEPSLAEGGLQPVAEQEHV